jgi:SAM-dependent methyltransferase
MLSPSEEMLNVHNADIPSGTVTNKDSINEYIWKYTKGVVQSGPFEGMQLVKEEAWKDGNLGTKCLGCYEQEMHEPVEQEIARLSKLDKPEIINIGCAEGYYAIGMARRLPNALVRVVDISQESLDIANAAAQINKVLLLAGGQMNDVLDHPDLIICDCEGAETIYLDMERHPGVAKASMIIESHDYKDCPTTEILVKRFNETHTISHCLSETLRAPNNFDLLCRLSSHAKWLAVSEGRPSTQYFLYMVPK